LNLLILFSIATYSDLVAEVLYAHDVTRVAPQVMADWLLNDANTRVVGNVVCKDVEGIKDNWCDYRVQLTEGRNGYDEVISKLKISKPLKSLEWSNALGNACWDLILDIGPNGLEGPLGSKKDTKLDWVK